MEEGVFQEVGREVEKIVSGNLLLIIFRFRGENHRPAARETLLCFSASLGAAVDLK